MENKFGRCHLTTSQIAIPNLSPITILITISTTALIYGVAHGLRHCLQSHADAQQVRTKRVGTHFIDFLAVDNDLKNRIFI